MDFYVLYFRPLFLSATVYAHHVYMRYTQFLQNTFQYPREMAASMSNSRVEKLIQDP